MSDFKVSLDDCWIPLNNSSKWCRDIECEEREANYFILGRYNPGAMQLSIEPDLSHTCSPRKR